MIDHDMVQRVIQDPAIAFVSFTGSVAGGRAVYHAVSNRFIDATLELGGKDPAYVAADADLKNAIENVVDGAFYNAGQSCCAVERVYVHQSLYDKFVEGAGALAATYKLGDPKDNSTNMGPIAQAYHPDFLTRQVDNAVKNGAKLVYGGKQTKDAKGLGRFFMPTVLANCNHSMRVMQDETFGPVLPIVKVANDEEALKLMNDSIYGLTASVWTSDTERAKRLGAQLNCGTVYKNRCDFLDPELSWSGRKDSGKGISLSVLGFNSFVRTKSYNFK